MVRSGRRDGRRRQWNRLLGAVVAALLFLCVVTAAAQASDWEALTALGMQALRDGQYQKAMQQFQAALAVADTLPPRDPRLATSLMNLATLYHTQKQYIRAASLYQRALQHREQTLGPAHPQVADVLEAYADLLHQQHPWRSSLPWSAAAKMAARARRIRQGQSRDEKPAVKPEPIDQWRWPQDEQELFGDSHA